MDRCHDCTLLDQRDPKGLERFVRNRVHEVHEVMTPVNWRHVRSEENPADAVTRGLDAIHSGDMDRAGSLNFGFQTKQS